MKGIRCLEIVSNPAFVEHTFFLFDSSLSEGPLGVEMIHFEPRACMLMTIRTIAMFRTKSVTAVKQRSSFEI